MTTEIYLCRHGETEWSLTGRHTGKTDIALTENGKKQAALLGHILKKKHFEAIYSSPRVRALETCKIAGFKEIIIDPDLQEWDYGDYEGLTTEEIKKINPHWHLFIDGAPGGEMPLEASRRADRMLGKLEGRKGRVAIFCHGHFSRVLAVRWLGLNIKEAKGFVLSPASMSILGFEHEETAIKLWNFSP